MEIGFSPYVQEGRGGDFESSQARHLIPSFFSVFRQLHRFSFRPIVSAVSVEFGTPVAHGEESAFGFPRPQESLF